MKVVQITDCHLLADMNQCGYGNTNPYACLEQVLAQVKSQCPDILLVTGDLSGDASIASYRHFLRLFEQTNLQSELYILPGNHDDQAYLQQVFAPQQLWLASPRIPLSNDWHLHLLNSQSESSQGLMAQHDLVSLQDYLSQHSQGHHLLAVHHHPIACGGWMDRHNWLNKASFNAIVANNSAVKAVVYGHIHMQIEQQQGGCWYLACPATCWQFNNSPEFSVNDLPPGFRVINLLEQGQISSSVYRI
jgi:Icc protein